MSEDMGVGEGEMPAEMLKGLHVTSYDDENGDDIELDENDVIDEDDDDDDDDDDDEDEDGEPVTLGFVEKPKNNLSLLRQLFPSKAGGAPAWLDPDSLPSGRVRDCDICGEPLQFLLQVYAPLSDRDSAFHRTLYLFMCPKMSCLLRDQHEQWKRRSEEASRSVKVFRCQLPRQNAFYSSEPPKRDEKDKPLTSGATLCNWCITWKGDKVCGSCKKVRYCSEKHQVAHWGTGHKNDCRKSNLSLESSEDSSTNQGPALIERRKETASSKKLWPEYEIINDDESEYDSEIPEDTGNANALVSRSRMDDESMQSVVDCFEGDEDKRSWASFQGRVLKAPEQVLRYCHRNVRAKPLWPMSSGRPSSNDIPKCKYCGGPRCFEFQVLPQLLYYFKVDNKADSLDWATIVVYTCEASCDASIAYKEEFVWVQLSSPSVAIS